MTTEAPSFDNSRAVPLPKPLDAPVMTTTLPRYWSLSGMAVSHSCILIDRAGCAGDASRLVARGRSGFRLAVPLACGGGLLRRGRALLRGPRRRGGPPFLAPLLARDVRIRLPPAA